MSSYNPLAQSAMNYMGGGSGGNDPSTGQDSSGILSGILGSLSDNPLGFAQLGISTLGKLFGRDYEQEKINNQRKQMEQQNAQLNQRFGLQQSGQAFNQGLATQDMGLKGLQEMADKQLQASQLQRFRDHVSALGGKAGI